MTRIGIILGSTRPGRNGERWPSGFSSIASHRDGRRVRAGRPASTTRCRSSMSRCRRRWGSTRTSTPRQWAAKIAVVRRVRVRDAGVQPRHLRCAEERHRLPLRRVEQQGRRLRRLRRGRRSPRRRAPAAHRRRAADGRRPPAGCALPVLRFRGLLTHQAGPSPDAALSSMLDELLAWSEALAPMRGRLAERDVA